MIGHYVEMVRKTRKQYDSSQRERKREREMRIEKEIRGWKKEEER